MGLEDASFAPKPQKHVQVPIFLQAYTKKAHTRISARYRSEINNAYLVTQRSTIGTIDLPLGLVYPRPAQHQHPLNGGNEKLDDVGLPRDGLYAGCVTSHISCLVTLSTTLPYYPLGFRLMRM